MTGKVVTTLSDEHLRELGRVTVSFALLEHHLQLLAWELIHDFALGPVVTAELGWRSLVALVSSLAHHRELDAIALKTLDDALQQADAAEAKRNTLIHSTWIGNATSEPAWRFKFTAKRGKGGPGVACRAWGGEGGHAPARPRLGKASSQRAVESLPPRRVGGRRVARLQPG